jgi:hypothetical protein
LQGCQIVCFQTKNPNLGKFWRVLLYKILVYFMTILSILRPLEIFYVHSVYFVVVWYIFSPFGILDQEKSGNPGPLRKRSIFFSHFYCNKTKKWSHSRVRNLSRNALRLHVCNTQYLPFVAHFVM